MKLVIGLLISALSISIAPSVEAAEAKITANPTNLSVAETNCFFTKSACTKARRNILLRTNQRVDNLQIITLDLNSTDGTKVFPANAITIYSPSESQQINSIPGNKPIKIPIEFDINQIPSGEFNGNLLITYGENELIIPMNVKVKNHWFFPLLILLIGIALGIIISVYRNEGIARDEILVKVASLRSKMRADQDLYDSFRIKIEGYLIDVETALENRRWQEAQEALGKAQGVWDIWRKHKNDWLDLIKSESKLLEKLEEENQKNSQENITFLKEISWQLKSIHRDIANFDSPQVFSEKLKSIREQINRFLRAKTLLQEFNDLTNNLPEVIYNEESGHLKSEYQNLQRKLYNLPPENQEDFEKWQEELENKTNELIKKTQHKSTVEKETLKFMPPRNLIFNTVPSAPQLDPIPQVKVEKNQENDKEKSARQRLKTFNLLSYCIAIFLLGGAGYTQLYAANKTFGSNGLTDYFALLAWGFGAEATRDTVTKLLQDWKLPGFKN
jgi:ElaB/YqjD/DUF883 family membrane-anchored ribosome-binding protein